MSFGGRPAEILLAVGEVKRVFLRPDRAVFCELALRHYSNGDGTPLLATVRLCSSAHGAGWGDWWVPDIGTDLIACFPGVGTNGAAGGELDEGYIYGVISSLEEPPVNGLKGALGPGRRVYKGRPGTAHDWHFQGNRDEKIDGNLDHQIDGNVDHSIGGNETRLVAGDHDRTVQGSEQTENVGVVERVFRALASWVGDIKLRFLCDLIEVGAQAGVFQKLLNKTAMDTYNNHVHAAGPTPTQQMTEDIDTTINLRAS